MPKTLLEHKADPNQACTDDGALPLYSALENGCVDIANVLLEHNAEPNKAKFDGKTPLDKATEQGFAIVAGRFHLPRRLDQQRQQQQQRPFKNVLDQQIDFSSSSRPKKNPFDLVLGDPNRACARDAVR